MTTRLHRVGRGFDSRFQYSDLLHPLFPIFFKKGQEEVPFFGRISLVVEHRTCNAEVVSSILTFGFLEPCLVACSLIRFQTVLEHMLHICELYYPISRKVNHGDRPSVVLR